MKSFWSNHKTKIMGAVVALIGYFQLPNNAALIAKSIGQTNLDILTMLAGAVIIVIGIVNSGPPPSATAPESRVGSSWLIGVLVFLITLGLMGCTGMRHAQKQADNLPEYAYVVGESYAAWLEEAAQYKEQGGDPSAVARLQALDRKTTPLVRAMGGLAESYQEVGDAETEAELRQALDEAVEAVDEFIKAVKDARGTPDAKAACIYTRPTGVYCPLPAA